MSDNLRNHNPKDGRKEIRLNENVLGELELAVNRGEAKSVKAMMEKIINDWAYDRYTKGEAAR